MPIETPPQDALTRLAFARARAAAPPEMDQGTIGIFAPDGYTVGTVYTIATGTNQFTEHWVVNDPRFLQGGSCTFSSLSTSAPNWANELAYIKATYNGVGGALDWRNFVYAQVNVTRATPPTQAQINAMPDMLPGHERRVFDLKNGATLTGGWYQDIAPIGSANRVDYWRMGAAYTAPTTGTDVAVARKGPPPPTGHPFTPQEISVKQFLTNWVNAGGYYVTASYSWGPLP